VTRCSQWCASPLLLVLIGCPPLRPVIEAFFLDSEATVLADGFL
jgi:hypothetical protein